MPSPPRIRRLRRSELPFDTIELARALIGVMVVRELAAGRISGRIVETEAYPPGDPASHAYRRRTPRNGAMFLRPGHAYVYLAYGACWMLNVSSEAEGVGAAVLVRALEPVTGLAAMQARRGVERHTDLTRGPGRLAQALAIDRQLDGLDLCAAGPLWLARPPAPPGPIGSSARIGITRAADRPWRFYERGNVFVSGVRRLSP